MILAILGAIAALALFALPHVLLGRCVGQLLDRLLGRR